MPDNHTTNANSSRQRLWQHVGWATAGRVSNALLSFLLLLLASRVLPATEFGEYLIFVLATGAAALLCQLGLAPIVARHAARHRDCPQSRGTLYVQALWLNVAAIAALALVHSSGGGAWLQQVLGSDHSLHLLQSPWFLAYAGLQSMTLLAGELLKADGNVDRYAQSVLMLAPAAVLAITIGLTLTDRMSPTHLIAAGCAAYGAALLLALTSLLHGAPLTPRKALLKRLPYESTPVLGNAVFAFGTAQLDMIFLAIYFPLEQVALYGFATRSIQFLLLPLHIAFGFAAPHVADLLQQPQSRLSRFCQQVSSACLLLSLGSALAILMAYPWLFAGVNEGQQLTGLMVVALLMIGQLVNSATSISSTTLEISGHGGLAMGINAATATLGALAFWLMNNELGLVGFAAVSALIRIALNSGMALANARVLRIRVLASAPAMRDVILLMHRKLLPTPG